MLLWLMKKIVQKTNGIGKIETATRTAGMKFHIFLVDLPGQLELIVSNVNLPVRTYNLFHLTKKLTRLSVNDAKTEWFWINFSTVFSFDINDKSDDLMIISSVFLAKMKIKCGFWFIFK